jgi:Ribonuclease G/E
MARQTVTSTPGTPDVVRQQTPTSNAAVQTLIKDIRTRWSEHERSSWKLGESLSKLRKATELYRKNDKTGMTYNAAVKQTGISHATAELHRKTYELCKSNRVSMKTFHCLLSRGINLGSKRFSPAASHEDVRRLKVDDEEAVESLVEILREQYPAAPPRAKEVRVPTKAELERMKATLEKQLEAINRALSRPETEIPSDVLALITKVAA